MFAVEVSLNTRVRSFAFLILPTEALEKPKLLPVTSAWLYKKLAESQLTVFSPLCMLILLVGSLFMIIVCPEA